MFENHFIVVTCNVIEGKKIEKFVESFESAEAAERYEHLCYCDIQYLRDRYEDIDKIPFDIQLIDKNLRDQEVWPIYFSTEVTYRMITVPPYEALSDAGLEITVTAR